jgi:hypothetical protein
MPSDKIKGFIAILIVAAAIYVVWNIVPPLWNNYQFQDTLDDIARRNSYSQVNDDGIKEIVITKAQSDNIILKPDQITISHTIDGLGISVHYQVHVDLIVYTWSHDFVTNSMNKRI